jgi:ParB family chromosome partitioning protein
LTTDDPKLQKFLAKMIADYGWSVRQTEQAVKSHGPKGAAGGARLKPLVMPTDPNVKAAETRLIRALSTNVKIVPARRGAGGKIEIEYYNADDLNRIYDVILSK